MFEKLRAKIARAMKPKNTPPEVAITPLPVTINPGKSAVVARHLGRLVNLYNVQARGDRRKEIPIEINQRILSLAALGVKAPTNEREARIALDLFRKEGLANGIDS